MKTPNKSSGIKGVFLKTMNNGKNKYWQARVQGRIKISRNFPFTELGKINASKFYKKTIEENRDRYYQYRDRKIKSI